ncbi:MAG: hypothetical protein CMJ58_02640 [Planctomycetaceae bacterium]|nr:hypothetical protein [Planctomycetaceae bacterium]
MIGVRIAAATRHLKQPFRKALHTAASLGVEGVQIDARDELRPADITGTAVRQVRKLLDDANLRVAGGVFPTRRGLLEAQDAERRLAAVRASMEMIAQLGGSTLVTNAGEIPAGDSPLRSDTLQILEIVAAAGQRLGVTPVLAVAESPPRDVVELLAESAEGTVAVELNPADLMRHDQSPTEWLDALGPHVGAMAATDAARGLGVDRVLEVELGRGAAGVDELLARLWEQYRYRGWIVVGRSGSPRAADEIADAASYVRACGQ